jgi:hypothetical protein
VNAGAYIGRVGALAVTFGIGKLIGVNVVG